MFQLIYVSAASKAFNPRALGELLRHSRENNGHKNITGMLFYHQNSFLQVLEGPEENVRSVARSIERDVRHVRFRILSTETVESKMFGQWTMGFVAAEHAANLVEEYTGPDVATPLLTLKADEAKEMLKFFKAVASNHLPF